MKNYIYKTFQINNTKYRVVKSFLENEKKCLWVLEDLQDTEDEWCMLASSIDNGLINKYPYKFTDENIAKKWTNHIIKQLLEIEQAESTINESKWGKQN